MRLSERASPAGKSASISVALCTYNGEKYLARQLDSFSAQSRPPDEMLICDDNSSDGTRGILDAFAKTAGFPVKIIHNPANLGFTRNFSKAISLCTKDLVFLADQDDEWRRDKLETLSAEMDRNPEVDLIFSDAQVVDAGGRPLRPSLWDCFEFGPRKRRLLGGARPWEVLIQRNVVSGCCVAARARLVMEACPIPEGVEHDAWLALVASLRGGIRLFSRTLVQYRFHGGNAIGLRDRDLFGMTWLRRILVGPGARIAAQQGAVTRLGFIQMGIMGLPPSPHRDMALDYVRDAILHRSFRAHLPSRWWKRWLVITKEIGRQGYDRHGDGILSVLADAFLGPGAKKDGA